MKQNKLGGMAIAWIWFFFLNRRHEMDTMSVRGTFAEIYIENEKKWAELPIRAAIEKVMIIFCFTAADVKWTL